MIREKKIIVCCSHSVTGGPELLHQLVHHLRSIGRDAYISYYPFDMHFNTPESYSMYDCPQTKLIDEVDTCIIIPEGATWITTLVKKSKVVIWWLSVNNFLGKSDISLFQNLKARYLPILKRQRLPLYKLKSYEHLVQSYYAHKFLDCRGIQSTFLSDYLGDDHFLNGTLDLSIKEDIVIYNPKKGFNKTQKLINRYPNLNFVPIVNMTPLQVKNLFSRAKIYIDFGHHPGKDRLPREAALSHCCVITGIQGAANYYEDLPIPLKYKLNDSNNRFVEDFIDIVKPIFDDYITHLHEFDYYRTKILNERAVFLNQVDSVFNCT